MKISSQDPLPQLHYHILTSSEMLNLGETLNLEYILKEFIS